MTLTPEEIDWCVFKHVRRLRIVSIMAIEGHPPRGVTGVEARVAAHRLVERRELLIDSELQLRLPKPPKPKAEQ